MELGSKIWNTNEIYKITSEVPSCQNKSIINYFLVHSQMWTRVSNIRVNGGSEIGSDYYLLIIEKRREK